MESDLDSESDFESDSDLDSDSDSDLDPDPMKQNWGEGRIQSMCFFGRSGARVKNLFVSRAYTSFEGGHERSGFKGNLANPGL